MPPALQPLVFCDLFGVDATQARRVLLLEAGGARTQAGPVASRCLRSCM